MRVYVACLAGGEVDGLAWLDCDAETGALTRAGSTADGVSSPLFVRADAAGRFLYVADHVPDCDGVEGGAVCAYAIDPDSGDLTFLNRQSSGGKVPCYVSVTRSGRFALVANYGDGCISVLPVNDDGSLAAATATIHHDRSDKDPHAHSIILSPDERFVLCGDLGIDRVLVYRFDPDTGAIEPNDPPGVRTADGAGPRHLALHPNDRLLYAMTEYDNTVIAITWNGDTGEASIIEAAGALPPDFTETSYGADIHIHPSGQYLYVSNRGHESIAVFAIDEATGKLSFVAHQATLGEFPRGCALDPAGRFLLVANEKSNTIVTFAIDDATGGLTETEPIAQITMPAGLCIVGA